MHLLPPPPPAAQCVAADKLASTDGNTHVVLSGEPAQLAALLAEVASQWQVEAKATDNGVAFARLKRGLNVPYKELGGLIIRAQQRQLEVSFYTDPRICGVDE
jgi:hypothetical protein